MQALRTLTAYSRVYLFTMTDLGAAAAIVGLCVAGVLGLYLLGACGAAPLLSRKEKNEDDDKDDPVRFSTLGGLCCHRV